MKRIISFSLYGKKHIYLKGILENIKLAKIIYPGWTVRVYLDNTVPEKVINSIQYNAEVINMTGSKIRGMYWRFFPMDDPKVDAFIVRDADSRLSARESGAVQNWMQSNKALHIMRDHPEPGTLIPGGMWGFKNDFKKDFKITESIDEFCKQKDYKFKKGDDQTFLKKIYQRFSDSIYVNDEFFNLESIKHRFPLKRINKDFIGSVRDENNKRVETSHTKLDNAIKSLASRRTLRIMVLSSFEDKLSLYNSLTKQSKGEDKWGRVKLVLNNPDYYIILNSPMLKNHIQEHIPEKSIIIPCEPRPVRIKEKHYIYQQNPKYLKFCSYENYLNAGFFWLKKSYKELKDIEIKKTKCLSAISGVKTKFLEGHKKRIEFIQYLEKDPELKYNFDVFGRHNLFNFKNYRGSLKFQEKDKGIFPYKYHLVIENYSEKNYISEKLYDGILSECLCFYWGCPNVEDHIDNRAIIKINLDNFEEAAETIKKAIKNNEWGKRLKYIKKEKLKVLEQYNFFPIIEKVINEIEITPKKKPGVMDWIKYYLIYRLAFPARIYIKNPEKLAYETSAYFRKRLRLYDKILNKIKGKT